MIVIIHFIFSIFWHAINFKLYFSESCLNPEMLGTVVFGLGIIQNIEYI